MTSAFGDGWGWLPWELEIVVEKKQVEHCGRSSSAQQWTGSAL